MAKDEIYYFFMNYPMKYLTFQGTKEYQDRGRSGVDLDLLLQYKNQQIRLNFSLYPSQFFCIQKEIPTTKKEVLQEVNQLIEHFITFLKNESGYRFAMLLPKGQPIQLGKPYSYVWNETKRKLYLPLIFSCLLLCVSIIVCIAILSFHYNIFLGLFSLITTIPILFLGSSFITWISDRGEYSRKQAKKRAGYGLLYLLLIFFTMSMVVKLG